MSEKVNLSSLQLKNCAHAFGGVVGHCVLRTEPEDFVVEEILGFAPDDEGDHLLLLVEKRGQNTKFVADRLAEQLEVSPREISYAGLKDRHALTTQWFCALRPGREVPELSSLGGEGWRVLAIHKQRRKLRPGSHKGNRFILRLRDVEADAAALQERLVLVSRRGVPNYFGEQRFGREGGNLHEAERYLSEAAAGRRRGRPAHREVMWLSAARSALFNEVLSARVSRNEWDSYVAGDVLMLDGRHSFFMPKDEDLAALPERLLQGDIHPTGPLSGKGNIPVAGDVLVLEQQVLEPWQDVVSALSQMRMEHQRRALRLLPAEMSWQQEEPSVWRISFVLPSGGFATSVLREILTTESGVLSESASE